MHNTGSAFFARIRSLSMRFGQDCLLFIEAGNMDRAFLYGTNDFFGINRIEYLGPLHIGSFKD